MLNAPKDLVGNDQTLRDLILKSEDAQEWLAGKNITNFIVPPKGFAVTINTD